MTHTEEVTEILSSTTLESPASTEFLQMGPYIATKTPNGLVEGPISALPEEIILLILDMLVQEDIAAHEDPPRVSGDTISTVRTASQVSRFWRFITLQNTVWWSHIHVFPPWRPHAVAAALARSKDCPIDLYISVQLVEDTTGDADDPSPSKLDGYEDLFRILHPHIPRCRTLHIQGVFRQKPNLLTYLIEPLLNMDMPYLTSLIFDGEASFEDTEYSKGRTQLFASAPRLLDVRLGGIGVMQYSPPLSAITTLHLSRAMNLTNLSFHALGEILTSCPCLTFFAVYDDLLNHWPGRSAAIELPRLEALYILGNMLSVSELLLYLTAPELRELVIAPVVGSDLTVLHAEMHTEQARFPNLRSLTLAPAHPDAFNDALPVASVCFPHIETLILANLYPPEFETLFLNHSRVLFPQLKDLALTGVEKVVARLMPEVARFRASKKAPLRNVFVDGESLGKLTGPPEIWGDVKVKKGDLWEAQRRKGLYSNIKDLFVGRPLDEH